MNARQMKKRLKKQIDKLQSDNDLMRRIIANSPEMQELYDVFSKPSNVIHTTLPFQEFKTKRVIPVYMTNTEEIIEHTKQAVAMDLFEAIRNDDKNIIYEIIDDKHGPITIMGSIFIGRK